MKVFKLLFLGLFVFQACETQLKNAPKKVETIPQTKKTFRYIDELSSIETKEVLIPGLLVDVMKNISFSQGEGYCSFGSLANSGTGYDLEIEWVDLQRKKVASIRFLGKKWKTKGRIAIGTTLKNFEQLNGGPFSLTGFDWDYGGGVSSYGFYSTMPKSLQQNLTIRFSPRLNGSSQSYSVTGDTEFKSTHPEMQFLNPVIEELKLTVVRGKVATFDCA